MPPYPQHEAEQERAFYRSCWQAIKHPSQIPTFFRSVYTDTRDYYAGLDLVDLDRAELTKLVIWTRAMSIRLTGSALLLSVIIIVALATKCNAEEPWTPDDFDWGVFNIAPKEQWNGLYLNLTEHPLPQTHELMALGKQSTLGSDAVLIIPFSVGILWQAFSLASTLGGIATAIQGCVTTDGSPGSVAGCAFGVAGTIVGIGSGYKAAQKAGWFASAANTWVRYL